MLSNHFESTKIGRAFCFDKEAAQSEVVRGTVDDAFAGSVPTLMSMIISRYNIEDIEYKRLDVDV